MIYGILRGLGGAHGRKNSYMACSHQDTLQDNIVAPSHFLAQVAKVFLFGHMCGGLVLGLTVISVEGYISNSV